ncbi:Lrp/AsnC family transcriptional regulator [Streptomyces hyaluromycini]|uniref:Lrp/AsnC family transcriptional regulator n=1 Tax=Streptomyces hyaluromycini TaxID=1377993 RepID=UPI001FE33CF8|nr:Lrp/AsnC family transcriptional regulator [Streptomyces hyaluromycini]
MRQTVGERCSSQARANLPGGGAQVRGDVLQDLELEGTEPSRRPEGHEGDALSGAPVHQAVVRSVGGCADADAPLLTELSRDGRAGVVELARSTGWSQARVSARLEQLLAEHAVYVAVDLAYDRFGFHATAYLWLTVAPGHLHATGETLSRHPATTFAASVTGAANLLVTVTCRNVDDLYMYVTGVVGAIPHVVQVDVVPVLHRLKPAGTRLQDGRLAATSRTGP